MERFWDGLKWMEIIEEIDIICIRIWFWIKYSMKCYLSCFWICWLLYMFDMLEEFNEKVTLLQSEKFFKWIKMNGNNGENI